MVDNNIAITAAHCAYSRENGEATVLNFSPARDENNYPYGTVGVTKYANASDCLGIGSVISGYPYDKGYSQYGANGYIKKVSDNKLWYTIDTNGGQSGSPIMDVNKRAYGVHTGGLESEGFNWGSRVNDRFYDLVQYAIDNY